MTDPHARSPLQDDDTWSMRAAIAWGVVVGVLHAATPLAFWWLDPATVYALGLTVIAPVYIWVVAAIIAIEIVAGLDFRS